MQAMTKRVVSTRNIRQRVYEIVRDIVVSNEIAPGAKIKEDKLARDLGVSKTPVREALSKLAHEGIVEIKPNRGAFKIKLTKEDILEIMSIREALEGLCIRLAAANATEKMIGQLKRILDDFETEGLEGGVLRYAEAHRKFHSLIYRSSKSPRLIRIIQSIYDLTHMLRLQYFSTPERVSRSLETHRKIVEALEKKDGHTAEKLRRDAIRSAYELLMEMAP